MRIGNLEYPLINQVIQKITKYGGSTSETQNLQKLIHSWMKLRRKLMNTRMKFQLIKRLWRPRSKPRKKFHLYLWVQKAKLYYKKLLSKDLK